jgi:Flp pilus assembly protein TadD
MTVHRRRGVTLAILAVTVFTSGCASWWAGAADRLGMSSREGETTWAEQMRAGDRFRRSGDTERAVVAYLRAWQQDPGRPLSQIRLAQLQLERDPQQAADTFRRVLVRHPGEAAAWSGLGVASLAQGRLEESRAAFAEAASQAPESALAHAGEAAALDLLGRPEEARAALARARERHPEEAWLLNNLAVSRLLARDWAGAEAGLRSVLALDPHDHTARNNLGLALGGQERYREALEAFREAGSEQAARNNLGYVLYLNGHYRDAAREYERALAAEGPATRAVLANLNVALDAINGRSGQKGPERR